MLFRFIDEQGNRSVADYPDNSKFVIESESNEMFYIAVHLTGPRQRGVLPVQRLVGGLEKDIANRCIDQIYEKIKTKSADCDLVCIQVKIPPDDSEENSANEND